MMSNKEITFIQDAFEYRISHTPGDDDKDVANSNVDGSADDVVRSSTQIMCTHIEECYSWFKEVSETIKDVNQYDKIKSNLFLEITPEYLFTLFKAYNEKTLDPIFNLKLPTSYKTGTTQLVIDIVAKLPYNSTVCTQTILLDPIEKPDSERVDSKLLNINNKYMLEVNELKSKIGKLEEAVIKLGDTVELNNKRMSELDALKSKTEQLDATVIKLLYTLDVVSKTINVLNNTIDSLNKKSDAHTASIDALNKKDEANTVSTSALRKVVEELSVKKV